MQLNRICYTESSAKDWNDQRVLGRKIGRAHMQNVKLQRCCIKSNGKLENNPKTACCRQVESPCVPFTTGGTDLRDWSVLVLPAKYIQALNEAPPELIKGVYDFLPATNISPQLNSPEDGLLWAVWIIFRMALKMISPLQKTKKNKERQFVFRPLKKL